MMEHIYFYLLWVLTAEGGEIARELEARRAD